MDKNKQLPEGFYSDETTLWGGSENKEDASIRLDFKNGRIYYENCYCGCEKCSDN